MKKVFVVTSGEYSSYRIRSVFSTKELAKKYASSFNCDQNYFDIEEWELDANEENLNNGRVAYEIIIHKDGTIKRVEKTDQEYYFSETIDAVIRYWLKDDIMLVYCFAKDADHAAKIAFEKRSQILAHNMWGQEIG